MNLPTSLTLFRIASIPALVVIISLGLNGFWAGLLYSIAAISDLLDGYLARRLKLTSRFGAFLDPVADKLLVVTILVMLTWQEINLLFAIPAMVMICREVAISALREWMSEIGKSESMVVTIYGKVKTGLQFSALLVFILLGTDGQFFVDLGILCGLVVSGCAVGGQILFGLEILAYLLLYTATVMTLFSMIRYLLVAWPDLDWMGNREKASRENIADSMHSG